MIVHQPNWISILRQQPSLQPKFLPTLNIFFCRIFRYSTVLQHRVLNLRQQNSLQFQILSYLHHLFQQNLLTIIPFSAQKPPHPPLQIVRQKTPFQPSILLAFISDGKQP